MEFVIFILFLFWNIFSFKMVKGSQDFTTTSLINVYQDKSLTQKTVSFDKVSYQVHKNKDVAIGLSFNVKSSQNSGIADNYFQDKATKQGDGTWLLRFPNFNKCESFSINQGTITLIQFGLLDNNGKESYITLSFPTENKSDLSQIAKDISSSCNNYINEMQKLFNSFYSEVEEYWKVKSQVRTLGDSISQMKNKMKKEEDSLNEIINDKKNFEKLLETSQAELSKTTKEKAEIEKKTKSQYKTINDIKTTQVKNEESLNTKSAKLETYSKDSKSTQELLDKRNEKSSALRKEQEKIQQKTSEKQKEVNEWTEKLTQEKKKLDELTEKYSTKQKIISGNVVEKASLQKNINSSKDLIDKLKIQDIPNTIDKTKSLILDFEQEIDEIMEETNKTDIELEKMNRTISESHKNITELLLDPKVVNQTLTVKSVKNMEKIKKNFDEMKKLFPMLPSAFMSNLFNYLTVNHREALNYLNAIKPSLYGLFDNTYNVNAPEVLAKKRKALKKKLRTMRKYYR
jgi:chromosome segregation ATPase